MDFVTEQIKINVEPNIDEGKRLLEVNKGLVTSKYRLLELPEEDRQKISRYILNNISKENLDNVSLGLDLIRHGDVSPSDLPLLGLRTGEVLGMPGMVNKNKYTAFSVALNGAFVFKEQEIDKDIRRKLTENLLVGIFDRVDEGHVSSETEFLFELIKDKIGIEDPEMRKRFDSIQRFYDLEKANTIEMREVEMSDARYLYTEKDVEYPRTADAVVRNILNRIKEDESIIGPLSVELGVSKYNKFGEKGKELIKKLLGLSRDYAEDFITLDNARAYEDKDIPELNEFRKIAGRTIVDSDKEIDGEKSSEIFGGVIKMEALRYDPNFVSVNGTWKEENLVIASNGFVATMSNRPLGSFPYREPEVERDYVRLKLGNFNNKNGFSVDFVPYDRAQYVEVKTREVLRMGVVGLQKFVETCNKLHIANNVLLTGETNVRMAMLIKKLGFVSLDLDEAGDIPKEEIDDREVKVFATVGTMKKALKSPFVTRVLETIEK